MTHDTNSRNPRRSQTYCHLPADGLVPHSPLPAGMSRRTLLKGATAAAGGLTLAAAGAGALGLGPGLPGLGGVEKARALTGKSLVLYDGSGTYGWIGDVHSKLMTNLLGRFLPAGSTTNTTVRKPLSQYQAGDTERYDATFYLGSVWGSTLPTAFKDDVMKTTKPVVWFKYNIEQLAWNNRAAFEDHFGLTLYGNAQFPTYSQVTYKGKQLLRNTIDPELSWMNTIAGTTKGQIVATIADPNDATKWPIPYITRSGNFWYVADIPFSYISEEDRYLAIADMIFDVLGISYTQTKRALVRLEDVSADSDPADLKACADYLAGAGVPFSIALIPYYKDPLGIFNNGQPVNTPLSQEKDVVAALKYMISKGGEIVMHGTTHQHGTDANPYNAVTGDDYEFFSVTENTDHTLTYVGPISGDSSSWCSNLLDQGMKELQKAGFQPFAFEAPHYAASAVDYQVMARKFSRAYHRALYFQGAVKASGGGSAGTASTTQKTAAKTTTTMTTGTSTSAPMNFGGQFFPYVIGRDIYGSKILPENLGNIEPYRWPDPVYGPYPTRFPADLIRSASRNLVVRDAYASFFYHPFWGVKYLQDSVEGIKALGYSFVKASSL